MDGKPEIETKLLQQTLFQPRERATAFRFWKTAGWTGRRASSNANLSPSQGKRKLSPGKSAQ